MPDIDIDFCIKRRGEVIDYIAQIVIDVPQIITFGTMQSRAVIRTQSFQISLYQRLIVSQTNHNPDCTLFLML